MILITKTRIIALFKLIGKFELKGIIYVTILVQNLESCLLKLI